MPQDTNPLKGKAREWPWVTPLIATANFIVNTARLMLTLLRDC